MQVTNGNSLDSTPTNAGQVPVVAVVASTAADAAAVEAVKGHHAQLAGVLRERMESVLMAVEPVVGADINDVERSRGDLVEFCIVELMPHAEAEERVLYPAAAALDEGRLLVDAMVAEHHLIQELVDQLKQYRNPVRIAATAFALNALFTSHLEKENDLILPLLASNPSVSLSELLAGMHELLGSDTHDKEPQA